MTDSSRKTLALDPTVNEPTVTALFRGTLIALMERTGEQVPCCDECRVCYIQTCHLGSAMGGTTTTNTKAPFASSINPSLSPCVIRPGKRTGPVHSIVGDSAIRAPNCPPGISQT